MSTITVMYATGDGVAQVDKTSFQIIIWISAGLPLPFLLLRLLARVKVFRKWLVDDYFVVLSWVLLLAFSTSWQVYSKDMYIVVNALAEAETDSISDIFYHATRFQNALVISYLLQAFCLWSIKSSFLAFFWKLGTNVKYQRAIWWAATVFNVACFAVWVGTATWSCIAVPVEQAVVTCNTSTMAAFSQASIKVETAVDVLSDISILIIPATLLWKSQIPFKIKLALGGIFSLTLFVMTASIIRVVVTTNGSQNDDLTWMSSWAGIEMGVAIVVACLCSFRALFTSQSPCRRSPYYRDEESLKRFGKAQRGVSTTDYTFGSPRKGCQRTTLYPLDSVFQPESFAETKASAEYGEKHAEDMRRLSELHKSHFGKVLVRNSITIQHEAVPDYNEISTIYANHGSKALDELDPSQQSWLSIESTESHIEHRNEH